MSEPQRHFELAKVFSLVLAEDEAECRGLAVCSHTERACRNKMGAKLVQAQNRENSNDGHQ